jgi:flagellar protein FliO/FliZ
MRMHALTLSALLALPALAQAEVSVDAGAAAVTAPAPAAPEPELPRSEPPEGAGGELDLGWTLLRTAVVLGVVIALVYLTLNVGLRRLLGIKALGAAGVVKVLERVPLDQRRTLYVVEAAGEVLLVGASDGSLGLITRLDPAEVARRRVQPPAPAGTVQSSPLVQKLLGLRPAAKPGEGPK